MGFPVIMTIMRVIAVGLAFQNHSQNTITTTTTNNNNNNNIHDPKSKSNNNSNINIHNNRRQFLQKFVTSTTTTATTTTMTASFMMILSANTQFPFPAQAAETIGKDPDCLDKSCLGVWDGLLADCPHGFLKGGGGIGGAGCTSSQDDTPGIFSEPWDYSEAPNSQSLDWEEQMRLLLPTIQLVCGRRGDQVQTLLKQGRYLRVIFTDGKTGEKSVGEFYFTPNDTTVQFRVGSLSQQYASGMPFSASLRNIERCEMIRKELRYTKIPVLRNRKRSLFFVESDLDTFGPGSAALGPPAEMKTGEIDGHTDTDPRLKIDLLQQFPLAK